MQKKVRTLSSVLGAAQEKKELMELYTWSVVMKRVGKTIGMIVMSAGFFLLAESQEDKEAMAQDGVITLEESVIKGRIQKPEAFYILQHAKLDYESLDAKPSFIGELVETVEEDPF